MPMNFGRFFSSSSSNLSYCYYLLIVVLSISLVNIAFQNYSFSQSTTNDTAFTTVKTNNSENFVIPFNDTNNDRRHPIEYVFDEPKTSNWIISIFNNLSYYNSPDSKTIIKIQERPPSQKFVELMLYGDQSKRFIVSVNTNETGYMRMYENNQDGWSTDGPITVSHANVQGLSVTNGKRIVLDKLGMNGFDVGSVSVYGKDDSSMPNSTYAGSLEFQTLSGDYSKSFLYYMPLGMIVGVGGILLFLIYKKKRDPE
ncbi:hypothetical protein [Candidatus Nitrosocosmicus sp. SS]|jgi:hypothetical protein|uniref:hypothetical protein n=2 Tax=Candidatus Nitrosocosmicus agrestis TaxID=2563600 RepID=UPI00122E1504|nr:hypothetical protein [Candidatus Nitrosocosmicus sp. SS]KAA2282439.1 hypothetical protein F1Z66_06005 [Candidatus Nitrosocosmicus sp. SS]KAF0868705.1 hypothetical protein E5N71_08445 [Candidatus Nitrosocosmicus sp. SS]